MNATSNANTAGEADPSGSTAAIADLGLSSGTVASLEAAGISQLAQLRSATELLNHPELSDGRALYELVCALNLRSMSLPAGRHHRVPGDREREMLRLRVIDGLTLRQIGQRLGVSTERVRQLLNRNFRLTGTPPAAKTPRKKRIQSGPRATIRTAAQPSQRPPQSGET